MGTRLMLSLFRLADLRSQGGRALPDEAPPALRGIQQAMRSEGRTDWALIVIAVVALVIVGLLVHVLVSAIRRRRRLVASWQEFTDRLERWGLEPHCRKLLRELASRYSPGNPVRLIEDLGVFEMAVHRHLKPLCARGPGEKSRRAAAAIRELREKLGLRVPSGVTYYSTRELPSGQEVQLRPVKGQEEGTWWAVVGALREDFLALQDVRPKPGGLQGAEVRVVFFSDGRAYSFETKVVVADAAASICLLEHTVDVRSAGARQFHRVQVNGPIAFRAEWEDEEVEREGRVRDFGAGGLALDCPCYYEGEEQLILHIEPGNYLPGAAGSQTDMGDRSIKGRIVESRRLSGGRCRYHIEFRDLDADERQYLFRLARTLELNAQE